MRRSRTLRVDPEFLRLLEGFRIERQFSRRRRVSMPELTGELAGEFSDIFHVRRLKKKKQY